MTKPRAQSHWARGRARTQQQLHAFLEQDLLCLLPDTGQELLVSQGHLGVNQSDLGTNDHRTEEPLSLLHTIRGSKTPGLPPPPPPLPQVTGLGTGAQVKQFAQHWNQLTASWAGAHVPGPGLRMGQQATTTRSTTWKIISNVLGHLWSHSHI